MSLASDVIVVGLIAQTATVDDTLARQVGQLARRAQAWHAAISISMRMLFVARGLTFRQCSAQGTQLRGRAGDDPNPVT